jgi:hypothetical protein
MELNWDNAKAWLEKANEEKEGTHTEPNWSWDCNFKLDFDGPLLKVSSRFYPPHYNSKGGWQGFFKVFLFGEEILKKEFECETLDKLREEVEEFQKHYASIVKSALKVNY